MSEPTQENLWATKVNWWVEELDNWYRKNHYPKKVWKDNEGLPFGIYGYGDEELEDRIDATWYKTEEERDKDWKKYNCIDPREEA